MKKNEVEKCYYIFDDKGKNFQQCCMGTKELADFLNRDIGSVKNSLSRTKKGIKTMLSKPRKYKVYDEKEFFKIVDKENK